MDGDKVSATDMDPDTPKGVGDSTTRRGEDEAKDDGREFKSQGKKGADRPVGSRDPDESGVATSENIDKDMPDSTPT
jgi:hypothetical protein